MRVEVTLATAEGARREHLELGAGATVADALAACSFGGAGHAAVAIYGELATLDRLLEDGERLDLLRELLVDPKEARRRRAGPEDKRQA